MAAVDQAPLLQADQVDPADDILMVRPIGADGATLPFVYRITVAQLAAALATPIAPAVTAAMTAFFAGLPSSSTGLTTGQLWWNGDTLARVP